MPVALGGVLAILGGALGPVLTHALGRNAKRAEIKRSKLELLLEQSQEAALWLERQRLIHMFGKDDDGAPSPMDRVITTATLYFPALEEQVSALDRAALSYLQWCLDRAQERFGAGGALVPLTDVVLTDYRARYGDLRIALRDLRVACGREMTTLHRA